MTQTAEVITWLRTFEDGITPGQALDALGIFRLAARISEAKERLEPGEAIVSEPYVTPWGKRVARYRLVKREPGTLGL